MLTFSNPRYIMVQICDPCNKKKSEFRELREWCGLKTVGCRDRARRGPTQRSTGMWSPVKLGSGIGFLSQAVMGQTEGTDGAKRHKDRGWDILGQEPRRTKQYRDIRSGIRSWGRVGGQGRGGGHVVMSPVGRTQSLHGMRWITFRALPVHKKEVTAQWPQVTGWIAVSPPSLLEGHCDRRMGACPFISSMTRSNVGGFTT